MKAGDVDLVRGRFIASSSSQILSSHVQLDIIDVNNIDVSISNDVWLILESYVVRCSEISPTVFDPLLTEPVYPDSKSYGVAAATSHYW